MPIKVSVEERAAIQADFNELRKSGMAKTEARKLLAVKYSRGSTTIWDNVHMEPEPEFPTVSAEWPKTYIITSWDIRVKPDMKFIECLKQMASYYDADLLLVPMVRGDAKYVPKALTDVFQIVVDDVVFNENLQLKYVETPALSRSPLTGFQGAYPDHSTIIPGLVRELKTEPCPRYIKQLMSTGSIGYLEASSDDYLLINDPN